MAKLGERGKQLYFFDVDGGSAALALRSGDPFWPLVEFDLGWYLVHHLISCK